MEYQKFSQREVCKIRTDSHKHFAKRFKEDTDLKCGGLVLPEKVAAASNYSKDVELELYQRRKFIDWRILGTTDWQDTFKTVFQFNKTDQRQREELDDFFKTFKQNQDELDE